jgi:hypothetical protein
MARLTNGEQAIITAMGNRGHIQYHTAYGTFTLSNVEIAVPYRILRSLLKKGMIACNNTKSKVEVIYYSLTTLYYA